jgi:radical SAM superfamily enzyme YgiQ (UPF0313 family)
MLLYLINPGNPMTSLVNTRKNKLSKYLIWKPLGLLVIAGLTPSDWEIKVIDENVEIPDYSLLPKPDLVGITAFTSQAPRAYEIATVFRDMHVPVVMGGIHVSMCFREALQWADAVVIGEAESVWNKVLSDVQSGNLRSVYRGMRLPMDNAPQPRHDLLSTGYQFGSLQTTRGCPLNCIFCSVSGFNGSSYRVRPVDDVIAELKTIKEQYILLVDDNLIGVNKIQIEHARQLFRAIIKSKIKKKFIAQTTINIADDEELLSLASKAGLMGVFIGFESITDTGLAELQKRFNIRRKQDMKTSVRKIRKHGIIVVGSLIMGLDDDKKGIGVNIARTSIRYGIDILNLVFLTPLPVTRLWKKFEAEGRILANKFPGDWKYYTLNLPVAKYMHLSWEDIVREQTECYKEFYSYPRILKRFIYHLFVNRKVITSLLSLIGNLNYKRNITLDKGIINTIDLSKGISYMMRLKAS